MNCLADYRTELDKCCVSDKLSSAHLPPVNNPSDSLNNWDSNALEVISSGSCDGLTEEARPSVSEMVRQVASNFIWETYLPGFVYHDEIQMYFNPETGYYFDQNTDLFYHPSTMSYYTYDINADSLEFFSRAAAQHSFSCPNVEHRASSLLGEAHVIGMSQEEVDVFECVNYLIMASSDDTPSCSANMSCCYNGECTSLREHDDKFEIERMIKEERIEYPPCVRLIDANAGLYVVTISGAVIGCLSDADIQVSCEASGNNSGALARILYDEITRNYYIECSSETILTINDIPLLLGDQRIIEHGDTLKIGVQSFVAHIHHGTNTCGSCEPGLLSSSNTQHSSQSNTRKLSSRVERLRTIRLLKAQYGLLHDRVTDGIQTNKKINRPSSRQNSFETSKETIGISNEQNSIYSKCSAKPVEGASSDSVTMFYRSSTSTEITDNNIGFKLLRNMGWEKGKGLGSQLDGIVDPILIGTVRSGREGFGLPSEQNSTYAPSRIRSHFLETTKRRYEADCNRFPY